MDNIADYIAENNLERAILFTAELERSFDDVLSIFLHGGYLHNKAKVIRMKSYKGYTAFYHVKGDIVEVLHIVNLEKPLEERGIDF